MTINPGSFLRSHVIDVYNDYNARDYYPDPLLMRHVINVYGDYGARDGTPYFGPRDYVLSDGIFQNYG